MSEQQFALPTGLLNNWLPWEALLLSASTHYILLNSSVKSTAQPRFTQIKWESIYLLYTLEYSRFTACSGCDSQTQSFLSEVIERLLKQFKVLPEHNAEFVKLKQKITEVYMYNKELAVRHLQNCLDKDKDLD